jgi:hypothetical protein
MVALTGIEPAGYQFSSVQLSLSGCVFSTVGIPGYSETPPRTADVTAQSQRSCDASPVHAAVGARGAVAVRAHAPAIPETALVRKRIPTDPCGMSAWLAGRPVKSNHKLKRFRSWSCLSASSSMLRASRCRRTRTTPGVTRAGTAGDRPDGRPSTSVLGSLI